MGCNYSPVRKVKRLRHMVPVGRNAPGSAAQKWFRIFHRRSYQPFAVEACGVADRGNGECRVYSGIIELHLGHPECQS